MKCLQCGHENPEGAQFCGGCGAPLKCSQCGRENPEGAQFCGGCGVPLRASMPIDVGIGASEPPKSGSSKTSAWRVLCFVGIGFVLLSIVLGLIALATPPDMPDWEQHLLDLQEMDCRVAALDDFTEKIEEGPLVLESSQYGRDDERVCQRWIFTGDRDQLLWFEPRPKPGSLIDFDHVEIVLTLVDSPFRPDVTHLWIGQDEDPRRIVLPETGTYNLWVEGWVHDDDPNTQGAYTITISETEAPVPTDTPTPTAKGLNHYEQGEQYLWQDENYLKAVESFTEYINLDPNDARGYAKRGNSYQELHRYQEALTDYDKAIELSPENFSDVYSNRGHVHRHLGQYLDAIRDYDKWLKLDPETLWPYHYKGMAYRDLGQYEVAIQNWETYVELRLIESSGWIESEQAADAYTNIRFAYTELGQYQKAIEHFDRALSVDPSYSDAVRGKEKAVENRMQ